MTEVYTLDLGAATANPQEDRMIALEKTGRSGTRHQASPDPHTTPSLNQKSRVVS